MTSRSACTFEADANLSLNGAYLCLPFDSADHTQCASTVITWENGVGEYPSKLSPRIRIGLVSTASLAMVQAHTKSYVAVYSLETKR